MPVFVCISPTSPCAQFVFLTALRARLTFPSCVCLPSAVSVTRCRHYKHCKYQAAVVVGLLQKHCGEKLLWSHESIILIGKKFSLRRCFVSSGPFQPVHREPADVCGQQGGCLCPAGAEDAGTVAAGYLCGQHLRTQ